VSIFSILFEKPDLVSNKWQCFFCTWRGVFHVIIEMFRIIFSFSCRNNRSILNLCASNFTLFKFFWLMLLLNNWRLLSRIRAPFFRFFSWRLYKSSRLFFLLNRIRVLFFRFFFWRFCNNRSVFSLCLFFIWSVLRIFLSSQYWLYFFFNYSFQSWNGIDFFD
jgi:hypothetical protein